MRRVLHWRKFDDDEKGNLNILRTLDPEELNTISNGECECIKLAVDSGATETVISEETVRCVPTKPSAASRRGVEGEYKGARS